MGTYYWDSVCNDGTYDGKIGSDANPPASLGVDRTGHSLSAYFWVGFMATYYNAGACNKGINASSQITILVRKDGGSWENLATSELAAPGTGSMVFTDLTPANANWFTGDTSLCCGTNEANGVAQDNGGTLTSGTGTNKAYRREFWFAFDPAGATGGSTYEFAVYDDNSALGTVGSPHVLDCSVTMAVAPVDLVMTDGGAYHPIFTNVDNSPIDITEVIALVFTDAGVNYHEIWTNINNDPIDIVEVIPPTDLVMIDGGAYHLVRVDNGVDIDLAQHFLSMADAFHPIVTNVDDSPIDLIQVFILVMSDAGMNYHAVRVDDGVDIDLVHVFILAFTDAGMNYHSIFTNVDNSPIDLVEVITLVISDAGMNYHDLVSPELPATQVYPDDCYHENIHDPTDITIQEVVSAVDLIMTDGGAYHEIFTNVDNSPLDLTEVIDLVFTEAGLSYHEIYDDGPLPATQVYPNDCYHLNVVTPTDLTLVEIWDLVMSDAGVNYHVLYDDGPLPAVQIYPDDCYHLNVVTPTDLTLVEIWTLVMSDAGVNYHEIYDDGPLPATQVYPEDCYHDHFAGNILIDPAWANANDCYHLHVVDPTDLALTTEGIHNIVFTDAGVNYHDLVDWAVGIWWVQDCYHIHDAENIDEDDWGQHFTRPASAYHVLTAPDPLWWIQNAYHLHTADAIEVMSVEGTYHEHVVTPTNLTVVEVGDVTLIMTDGGAYHVLYDDGPLPATQVYPALGYSEVVTVPTNITLVEVIDLTIAPDPYHNLVTKDEVWFVQKAEHEHSVAPTNLTLEHTHFLIIDSCFHVLDDGVDIVLVHILNLTMSDAGLNYHAHVVTPTNLNLAGIVSLTMTDGGAYHLDVVTPTDLDLTTTLAPADGVHLHVATTMALTQDHSLTIAGDYHLHTAGSFTMVVDTGLDVLDAVKTLHDIGTKYNVVDLTTDRTLHRL